jgi:hypothetical protein
MLLYDWRTFSGPSGLLVLTWNWLDCCDWTFLSIRRPPSYIVGTISLDTFWAIVFIVNQTAFYLVNGQFGPWSPLYLLSPDLVDFALILVVAWS